MDWFEDSTRIGTDPECGHAYTVRTLKIQGQTYTYISDCGCPPPELEGGE